MVPVDSGVVPALINLPGSTLGNQERRIVMAKMYAINKDSKNRQIIATCECKPGATEIDWARVKGCEFYELKDAIKLGGHFREGDKLIWVGVNLRVRITDGMMTFWWDGKWRTCMEWNRSKKPSDKWVQKHLECTARYNCPLNPKTVIIWHWA